MKSRFFKIVTPLLMFSVLLFGSTPAFSSKPPVYNSAELTNRLKTGAYLQKTDNLMIIVDGLGETFLGVGEPRSQKIGRLLISNIGKTIPKIPHRRMLRAFGPDAASFEKDFSTIFGLYSIDAKGFTPIIATKTLAISDFDPLGMTFISATKDLRKLSGSHAVVLISDGINIPKSALYESAYMKKKFRGSVCYYPILVGNDPQGTKNMSTIAKIGGCGFLAQYEAVDSPAELTNYVEKIFFAKRRMPVKAVEPEVIPEPSQVEEPVAPVLTDTPEVTEIVEEPAIPEIIAEEPLNEVPVIDDDIIILERQLPHDKVVTIELHVEFDLNKASLRPGYDEEIKKIADFMTLYPETEALIEGHTCNLGSEAYNQQLSSRRANTVKKYLVKNFALDPARLKTRGAGESEPIADNSTEEGRMKNRRVVAVISTIVTDYVTVEQEILKSDFLSDDFVLPPVDQVVDEMMQQEIVDEPQETNTPESSEGVTAPEVDSSVPEGSTEIIAVPEQPNTSEAVEIPGGESVQTPQKPGDTKVEPTAESSEVTTPVEEQDESAVEDTVDVQKEAIVELVAQPKDSSQSQEPGEENEPTIAPAPGVETTSGDVEPLKPSNATTAPDVASPQAVPSEDVVVVSPGESAFDDKGAPEEVNQMDEVDTEPVLAPEEVQETEPLKPKETKNKAPSKKVAVEEDSYL